MVVLLLGAGVGAPAWRQGQSTSADSAWDVVVLGRIDFCLVCQREPPPNVRFTQVLAGRLSPAQAVGQLGLTAMDARLLPEDGVPIYKSQREEIVFLKKVVVPGYEGVAVYAVVDIEEATPENLAAVRAYR